MARKAKETDTKAAPKGKPEDKTEKATTKEAENYDQYWAKR